MCVCALGVNHTFVFLWACCCLFIYSAQVHGFYARYYAPVIKRFSTAHQQCLIISPDHSPGCNSNAKPECTRDSAAFLYLRFSLGPPKSSQPRMCALLQTLLPNRFLHKPLKCTAQDISIDNGHKLDPHLRKFGPKRCLSQRTFALRRDFT